MHLFENDIRTEAELIWDSGKLFAGHFDKDEYETVFDPGFSTSSTPPNLADSTPLSNSSDVASEFDERSPLDVIEENEPPVSLVDERMFLIWKK